MKLMPKKNCLVCGKEFEKPYTLGYKQWEDRKVCSHTCHGVVLHDKFYIKTDPKTCVVCGNEFDRPYGYALEKWSDRKTCSTACGNELGAKTRTGHSYYPGRWDGYERPKKICVVCLKDYERPGHIRKSQWERQRCCSIACRAVYNRSQGYGFPKGHKLGVGNSYSKGHKAPHAKHTEPKVCETCGKVFERKPGVATTKWARIKACSQKCGHKLMVRNREWKKGSDHPNWKGGVTALRKKIQAIQEYKNWRTAVFKRDNYTCQDCGAYGVYLNADHKKAFSVIIREHGIESVEQAKACHELWDISNGRAVCVSCHRKTETYGLKQFRKNR